MVKKVEEVPQEKAEPQESLSVEDKHHLEVAKVRRQLVLSQAEKALAQNEAADVSFKYLILQLHVKYHITDVDGLDDNGNIFRNVKKQ